MNERIKELAEQAGFAEGIPQIMGILGFVNFAKLVAEKERNACAKYCETLIFIDGTETAMEFAKQIRAKEMD
jgi:hypothetical protein